MSIQSQLNEASKIQDNDTYAKALRPIIRALGSSPDALKVAHMGRDDYTRCELLELASDKLPPETVSDVAKEILDCAKGSQYEYYLMTLGRKVLGKIKKIQGEQA